MKIMANPRKGELISACNALIKSRKPESKPKIDEWLFPLANKKRQWQQELPLK